ncbi:putative serine hydrolase [Pseudolycoriella hygida]|uniref:Serine hydrolase n=1 Tax=Pseudolycoriella hygida TaxID=35572 RepID=A0A9Q0RV91_9DIPT|nr:putative serine hydrolase [Pseudolycoriella hygida]
MIQSNDIERQVEELKINVPWGHIACKWWGPKAVRPILCIHGWQDNSASFDPLIIQLPDHLSYLAIDLPGHGLSSRIPDGMFYSIEVYFTSVMLICDYFQWEKVSLLGHSLGSVISFYYASIFPDKCDLVIGLDTLKPYSNIFKLIQKHFNSGLRKSLEADSRNREKREPPSYTYKELLAKIKSGIFMEIRDDSAPYLLQRSVLPSTSEPSKYFFARDGRLRSSPIPMMDQNMLVLFAGNITSPYCFIKSSVRARVENQAHYNEVVDIMRKNPYFEIYSVEGDHHVHLNEPTKVSGIMTEFIEKYRPKKVSSKL